MANSFPCTGCGQCCKAVGSLINQARQIKSQGNNDPAIKLVAEFPHPVLKNGTCSKLGADNKCTIYDNRPLVCNIQKVWETFYRDNITWEEYTKTSATSCNKMVTEAGMSANYLVKL